MKAVWPFVLNKKHVIWDWNGTLLNDIELCLKVTAPLLEELGLEPLTIDRYREVFGFPIKDYYKRIGFDFEKHCFNTAAQKFMDSYNGRLDECTLHDGVTEILHELRKRGIVNSLLSATREDFLHFHINKFGVADFFDNICGIKDLHAVSKLESGRELISRTNIPKEETLLIGDTDHDLEVGEALGVEVLILADGHQSYERLRKKHNKVLKSRHK